MRTNKSVNLVDKEIYKIFDDNKWKYCKFYENWSKSPNLQKRFANVKNVIKLIKKDKVSHKLVIPFIVSQIDGILNDIYILTNINSKTLKQKEILNLTKKGIEQFPIEFCNYVVILFDLFFGGSKFGFAPKIGKHDWRETKYEDLKDNKLLFNRHKIQHGEDSKALSKPNLIRSLLILELTAEVLLYLEENKDQPIFHNFGVVPDDPELQKFDEDLEKRKKGYKIRKIDF